VKLKNITRTNTRYWGKVFDQFKLLIAGFSTATVACD